MAGTDPPSQEELLLKTYDTTTLTNNTPPADWSGLQYGVEWLCVLVRFSLAHSYPPWSWSEGETAPNILLPVDTDACTFTFVRILFDVRHFTPFDPNGNP